MLLNQLIVNYILGHTMDLAVMILKNKKENWYLYHNNFKN